jgi:hypothetical protein
MLLSQVGEGERKSVRGRGWERQLTMQLPLLHAVGAPTPYGYRDCHTRTAIAVGDLVRSRMVLAFRVLLSPLREFPYGVSLLLRSGLEFLNSAHLSGIHFSFVLMNTAHVNLPSFFAPCGFFFIFFSGLKYLREHSRAVLSPVTQKNSDQDLGNMLQ